jgi:hypothetical protein
VVLCVLLSVATVLLYTWFVDSLYTLCMFLLVAVLAVHTTCPSRYLVPALFLLALLSLVKFSFFLSALGSVMILSAHLLINRRGAYALLPLAWFCALFLVLWVGLGQSVGNLPAYARGSLEMAAGYSQAMSCSSGYTSLALGIACILALGAAFLPLSPSEWANARRLLSIRHAGLLLLLAWLVFSAWKHGFVRDCPFPSHSCSFFVLAVSLPFLVAPVFPAYDWKLPARVALLTACVCLGAIGFIRLFLNLDGMGPANLVSIWRDFFLERVRFVFLPSSVKAQLDDRLAAIRAAAALPLVRARVGRQPVDVISFEQRFLFLNGLSWKTRPVLQSHGTYTPYLVAANAEFFRRDDAPRYVLFKLQPIDNRLPSSEDGEALIEILRRYRPVLTEQSFLLLERLRGAGNPAPAEPVWEKSFRFGEEVSLGELPDGCHVAALKIRLSPGGAVQNALLKAPEVSLKVRTAAGADFVHRIVPGMVEDGFLLNPLLLNNEDVLAFYGTSQGERVISVAVTTDDTSCFDEPITMAVKTFPRPDRDWVGSEDLNRLLYPMMKTPPAGVRLAGRPAELPPKGLAYAVLCEGKQVLLVQREGELHYDVPPWARRLTGRFGVLPESYEALAEGGVRFTAEFTPEGGGPVQLFERRLDPRNVPGDRGPQAFMVELGKRGKGKVILRAVPEPGKPGIPTVCGYWTEVERE